MASPTDYHELARLSQGELNWHELLNRNLDDVDERLERRGPVADRPSGSNVPDGAKFYATDQRIVYEWDADSSAWDAVAGAGTDSNPLPEQTVQSLSAEGGAIGSASDFGPSSQELITNGSVTVTVPGDYPTPQDAVDAVAPLVLRHTVTIQIADGEDFSSQDLAIPPVRQGQIEADAEVSQLRIVGDATKSNMPTLKSIYVSGCSGVATVSISGVEIAGISQISTDVEAEASGIIFYGSGGIVSDCSFTDPGTSGTYGVRSYQSVVKLQGANDFGTGRDFWGVTKRAGWLYAKDGTQSGNPTQSRAFANGGGVVVFERSSIDESNLNKIAKETAGGLIIDADDRAIFEPNLKNPELSDGTLVKGGTAGQLEIENADDATTTDSAQLQVRDDATFQIRHNAPGLNLLDVNANGQMILSAASGQPLIFGPSTANVSLNDVPVTGLHEYSDPTAGDLGSREFAWDNTNDRWLFKDSSGTVHYFTPDGTL